MLRKGDTAVLGCEDDDIMAIINKISVILQLELNLLLGFEDDDNTALINKDGVILQPELNLQSSSSSRTGRSACWTRRLPARLIILRGPRSKSSSVTSSSIAAR